MSFTEPGVRAGASRGDAPARLLPALFARDNRTGRLGLWVGDAANGVPAGAPTGTRYLYTRHGFDANEVSTLWAACRGRGPSVRTSAFDDHKFGKPVVSRLK